MTCDHGRAQQLHISNNGQSGEFGEDGYIGGGGSYGRDSIGTTTGDVTAVAAGGEIVAAAGSGAVTTRGVAAVGGEGVAAAGGVNYRSTYL